MNIVRWNVSVSQDTDTSLRLFLASHGSGKKGGLSQFIEEAVRVHILELTAEEIKASNANVPEGELNVIIHEAIDWARKKS